MKAVTARSPSRGIVVIIHYFRQPFQASEEQLPAGLSSTRRRPIRHLAPGTLSGRQSSGMALTALSREEQLFRAQDHRFLGLWTFSYS